MAAARAGAEGVGLASTVVLARLIPPSEYGRAIIAFAFSGVTSTFFRDGLTAPLVQRPEVDHRQLRAIGFLAIALGALLGAVFAFVLPVVLEPVFGAETASLVSLLWPLFAIEALGVVPRAILQRRLDFRALGALEVGGVLVAAATTLGLAFADVDAEALLIGLLVSAAVQSAVVLVLARPPRPSPAFAPIRELLAFGAPAALSSFVYQVFRNVDYTLLGARLGAEQAGLFWRAYTLAMEYPGKVSGIMQRLAFPLYARTESPEQLQRLRGRIVRAHATALFPLLVALIALAPTLVPFMFGERWSGAVVPAQLLAVAGLFSTVLTGSGPLLLAVGRPGVLLALNVGNLGAYAAVVFVLAPSGLRAVALGATAFFAGNFVITHLVLERVVGLPFAWILREVLPAAASGAVMLGVSLPLAGALRDAGVPALLELAVVGAAGALVYAATLRTAFRATWGDMVLLATTLVRRRVPS